MQILRIQQIESLYNVDQIQNIIVPGQNGPVFSKHIKTEDFQKVLKTACRLN